MGDVCRHGTCFQSPQCCVYVFAIHNLDAVRALDSVLKCPAVILQHFQRGSAPTTT